MEMLLEFSIQCFLALGKQIFVDNAYQAVS